MGSIKGCKITDFSSVSNSMFVLHFTLTIQLLGMIVHLITFTSRSKLGTSASFLIIGATISAPSVGICGNADINVLKSLGSFVDVSKCSIKLYPKIGFSTDSLMIKNGTFIFSVLGFNAKFIKSKLSILKLQPRTKYLRKSLVLI